MCTFIRVVFAEMCKKLKFPICKLLVKSVKFCYIYSAEPLASSKIGVEKPDTLLGASNFHLCCRMCIQVLKRTIKIVQTKKFYSVNFSSIRNLVHFFASCKLFTTDFRHVFFSAAEQKNLPPTPIIIHSSPPLQMSGAPCTRECRSSFEG